jgi:protein-tyrosine-phosphatase
MAQMLFRARLRQAGLESPAWRVESAGTWAKPGMPATTLARETMAKRGLDLSHHRARIVSLDLLAPFSLILVMETFHKEALRAEFPALSGRIFMLSEMADRKITIDDPIGGSAADYQFCAEEIDQWIGRGWEKILQLA